VFFEVFGDGRPTLVLVPANPIVHSRQWKAQVPYLARHYRVVTFDGRGNGRSDRPADPAAYTDEAYVRELAAVVDATGPDPVVLVGLCHDGVWRSLVFAADHPERVAGVVAISVGVPLIAPPHAFKLEDRFDEQLGTDEGWAKRNRHAWRRDYRGFVEFFDQMFPEPHSTKQVEDCVGWGLEASLEAMLASMGPSGLTVDQVEATCRRLRAPLLLIHGDDDRCQPLARAERLAELTGAPLAVLEGAGHLPTARHPVDGPAPGQGQPPDPRVRRPAGRAGRRRRPPPRRGRQPVLTGRGGPSARARCPGARVLGPRCGRPGRWVGPRGFGASAGTGHGGSGRAGSGRSGPNAGTGTVGRSARARVPLGLVLAPRAPFARLARGLPSTEQARYEEPGPGAGVWTKALPIPKARRSGLFTAGIGCSWFVNG